ncbi:cryptochrome-like cry2 domain protein [Vibrio cholerae]|nr:cryptochrome-like cry2 domain protein [Vibrio cholerae]
MLADVALSCVGEYLTAGDVSNFAQTLVGSGISPQPDCAFITSALALSLYPKI